MFLANVELASLAELNDWPSHLAQGSMVLCTVTRTADVKKLNEHFADILASSDDAMLLSQEEHVDNGREQF